LSLKTSEGRVAGEVVGEGLLTTGAAVSATKCRRAGGCALLPLPVLRERVRVRVISRTRCPGVASTG
jgi:hypothetical protein